MNFCLDGVKIKKVSPIKEFYSEFLWEYIGYWIYIAKKMTGAHIFYVNLFNIKKEWNVRNVSVIGLLLMLVTVKNGKNFIYFFIHIWEMFFLQRQIRSKAYFEKKIIEYIFYRNKLCICSKKMMKKVKDKYKNFIFIFFIEFVLKIFFSIIFFIS